MPVVVSVRRMRGSICARSSAAVSGSVLPSGLFRALQAKMIPAATGMARIRWGRIRADR